MYEGSVRFYDEIYSYKDYKAEDEKLHRIISRCQKIRGNSLLDVACGTGNHITYLKMYYRVEGLDINRDMLNTARKKHPDVKFYEADMTRFTLGQEYDAIVCLFSAIGHVKTLPNLGRTLKSIKKHVCPGGVIIIESWFSPKMWKAGTLHSNFVDKPQLKLARINISSLRGSISINKMHYLVDTPSGIEYFVENLELGLFTKADYLRAFGSANLRSTTTQKALQDEDCTSGHVPPPRNSSISKRILSQDRSLVPHNRQYSWIR